MTLIYSWSVPSPEVRDLGPGVRPVRLRPSSMGAGLLLVVGVAAKQTVGVLSLIHISEPTRLSLVSSMPSSA